MQIWGYFIRRSFCDDMNLSFKTLTADINDLNPVCDTHRRPNILNTIIYESKFYKNITCPSIRTVDVSGAHFPNTKIVPKLLKLAHLHLGTGRFPLPILKTVTTIYANSLTSPTMKSLFLIVHSMFQLKTGSEKYMLVITTYQCLTSS